MIWAPGMGEIVEDRLLVEGGWTEKPRARALNLYRPPTILLGDAAKAKRWIDHVKKVFPQDWEHVIKFLAHRVQHPNVKINHALLLGGDQGVGKDTILEPVKYAVGPWNFAEISPAHMVGRFNGFIKSVILRISEAKDEGGELNRYQFYEHMKTITAAPPDVLRCDEKYIREHYLMNVTGVIITTNHKTDGIYLPPTDRRHYVAWSDLRAEDFSESYWREIYGWYGDDGNRHVAAYLTALDISGFDPKAPPLKTAAFWDMVDANRAPESAELADVFDKLGNPDAVTIGKIVDATTQWIEGSIGEWIRDRKNSRTIPHRLEQAIRGSEMTQPRTACGRSTDRDRRCTPKAICRLAPNLRPPAPWLLVSEVSEVSGFLSYAFSLSHPLSSVPLQEADTEAWIENRLLRLLR